ncbi:hypothetical protein J2X76_006242 [Neorhizobium sp. 2083]|uniref:hypothetical protein n=1 Tax=Neorhizobium sp. 2083 TaxID=2817762 RepID=UPI00285B3FD3|nr:hypothetical protein [Neorhizobium sp. 2083]MDR6821042.1 hypothetical protein [Neorhizobium sp. 2083]
MNIVELTREPVADMAPRLEAMTVDEVFAMMDALEKESEHTDRAAQDEVLARIALIQDEIDRRFPGQRLAPYQDWKKSQLLP